MAVETSYITHSRWTGLSATELTYPDGRQVSSGYDPLYRRNSIKETSGGASIASWQFFGQRTATTSLGNGITTSYMNDAQNRSAIQYGQTTPGWGSITTDQLGYDGAGRLIGKRHFNGSDVTVGFTSAYDKSSNKLFERPLHAESRASLYDSYDSMNRLLDYQRGVLASGGGSITTPISLPYANQEQAYNLDGLGNWTSTTITPEGGSPAVQSRIHNKLNEVTKYGATSVFYDHGNNTAPHGRRGNGNIADDGIRTYAYDAFNRLTTISRKSDGATIGQYTYDALGRRIQKITSNGGVSLAWSTLGIAQWSQLGVQDWANLPLDPSILNATYRYVCDGQQIVEELDGSDSTTRQFIWGQYIDELIQMKTYVDTGSQPLAAGTYYLLSDLLYRSTALTDSSGDIQEAYDCDAYGNTLIFSGPGTDDTWFTDDDVTSLQPACETIFTGRQYDPESQIYFYRARYYHPQLGRFVSRDPIDYRSSINIFEYVLGRAPILTDFSGLAIYNHYPFVKGMGHFDATLTVHTTGGTPKPGKNPGGIQYVPVQDPNAADIDITFTPNHKVTAHPCHCTRISFTQYFTDNYQTHQGAIVGSWVHHAWQVDGANPYRKGRNTPWVKGGTATSTRMQDAPGDLYNVVYWAISFKSQAVCRAGPDKGKSYGTLNWGLIFDWTRNVKQYTLAGQKTNWLPIKDVATTLTVSNLPPTH